MFLLILNPQVYDHKVQWGVAACSKAYLHFKVTE